MKLKGEYLNQIKQLSEFGLILPIKREMRRKRRCLHCKPLGYDCHVPCSFCITAGRQFDRAG